MADNMGKGATAFNAFLEKHGITKLAAAAALAVSDPTIHDWATGSKAPRHEHRLRIERWTSGEVPVAIWIDDEAAASIDAVQPFQPLDTEFPKAG